MQFVHLFIYSIRAFFFFLLFHHFHSDRVAHTHIRLSIDLNLYGSHRFNIIIFEAQKRNKTRNFFRFHRAPQFRLEPCVVFRFPLSISLQLFPNGSQAACLGYWMLIESMFMDRKHFKLHIILSVIRGAGQRAKHSKTRAAGNEKEPAAANEQQRGP